jgi:hypothetical protein
LQLNAILGNDRHGFRRKGRRQGGEKQPGREHKGTANLPNRLHNDIKPGFMYRTVRYHYNQGGRRPKDRETRRSGVSKSRERSRSVAESVGIAENSMGGKAIQAAAAAPSMAEMGTGEWRSS